MHFGQRLSKRILAAAVLGSLLLVSASALATTAVPSTNATTAPRGAKPAAPQAVKRTAKSRVTASHAADLEGKRHRERLAGLQEDAKRASKCRDARRTGSVASDVAKEKQRHAQWLKEHRAR